MLFYGVHVDGVDARDTSWNGCGEHMLLSVQHSPGT